jgi:glycosyltransferase involved in cell wall biosynthesis
MAEANSPIRVLYSFPFRLGGGRISTTAWYQVGGLAAAGADVLVFSAVAPAAAPFTFRVQPTLSRGGLRVPYRLVGTLRALAWHDSVVSHRLERLRDRIDIIHTWPLSSLRTLRTAARLGIPTVYERPNAHTRFAYEVVQRECERLGVSMPKNHEHAFNGSVLRIENEEYRLADRLLCPSDFVVRSFLDQGFARRQLARHQYGFDPAVFYPPVEPRHSGDGLKALFVGGCAPRKGLHYALDAWLKSAAHQYGTLEIAGEFIPGYAERLSSLLSHPSVRILGQRNDVPRLMRASDVLVLPSIEEGSALVTYEARGSGCVLLVSDAAGAICTHLENALVHRVGDIDTLEEHFTLMQNDPALRDRLRSSSLRTVGELTWASAGKRLLEVYRGIISDYSH